MTNTKIYKRTIKGIRNESMLDRTCNSAERAKCKYVVGPFSVSVVVSGTRARMEKFIKLYNSY